MTLELVDRVARAVLYEGYLLYPYRASSAKNRQRFTFGGLYPPAWSEAQRGAEPSALQAECLVEGDPSGEVDLAARFLHLVERDDPGAPRGAAHWQEACEQAVPVRFRTLDELARSGVEVPFAFPGQVDELDGVRRRREALAGVASLAATRVDDRLYRVTARVRNATPFAVPARDGDAGDGPARDAALLRTFASTHAVLRARAGAAFVSLLEPPARLAPHAARCAQVGVFPVLVGPDGARDAVLASPIILYDYPRVAAESPGDLFDATEIDEILTLRVLTMTEAEKAEARATDPRARALLDRTEALTTDDLLRLHGALREPRGAPPGRRAPLGPGARVTLRPSARADVFDIALRGMTATVVSVEHDAEGRVHYTVVVDDDPGRDLGLLGQPGHRFFFYDDEVCALEGDGGPT